MPLKEIDVLGQAIAETEKEIFSEANGQEESVLDETGNRSPELMGEGLEGQHEPESDADDAEEAEAGSEAAPEAGAEAGDDGQPRDAKGQFADKGEKPDDGKGRVPSARLREQTAQTNAAEARAKALETQIEAERAQSRREFEALNARLDGVLATVRQPPKPADAPKAESPDIFENPQAFVENLRTGFRTELNTQLAQRDSQIETMRVETSMQIAAGRHGEQFAKAFESVNQLDPRNPDDQAMVRRIWSSPNPGESLVRWHRSRETLREVGDDPGQYREKIAAETRAALLKDPEFRKQMLADLRADAESGDNGKPRTVTRLPKSLNGTSGGSNANSIDPALYDNSESAVFDSAFNS